MRGTVQNKVDRETRFNNKFDQFVAEPGEALVSVYNRFAQLMNDLKRNDIIFPNVTINTKFLNCLQSEWLKAKKVEKSHDPLALVAHTGFSSRTTSPYYVTHPSSVVDYDEDYQGDAVQNTSDDPLTSAMILLARAITQRFSNLTNNRLRTSFNTRNQAIVQADRVQIQSRNSGNDGRNTRHSYVQEEVIEGINVQNDAGNDEAGVILTDEQNDFLFADALRMEEIEELSANICLMARIQPANFGYDKGSSYDYAFLSEQPKIINNTIGDNQIDSNIIFDEPNEDVNSGSVEYDNNVQESYALEQLARNAYKEAEKQQIVAKKVQQQNTVLTKQLERYKEKVRVFEMNKGNNTTYFNEYIEADRKAKQFEQESQSQFIHDRDVIRDLEQQRDKLELSVLNALYEDFVPQEEFSAEQKYFSSSFISSQNSSKESSTSSSSETKPTVTPMPSENPMLVDLNKMENDFKTLFALLQTNSKRESIFYTSLEEIRLTNFCQQKVKPILYKFHLNFEIFQKLFLKDIKEMKDFFDSTENDLSETWKQNELLKDQLLKAKIKHEIECCVLLSHECVDNKMQDEIEKIQRDSIEIQEGMQKRINILENDVQRCQTKSLDFELQLQHEKERRKCESSLKTVCETCWISKMEKLESENVSLEF
ncbi:hypothetical protein Tco_1183757 [Tanacetum coccineum]